MSQHTPKKSRGNKPPVFDRWAVSAAIRAADGLKPLERLVLLTMLEFSNPAHETVWPSQKTIARETGLCRRSLTELVKILVGHGALVRRGERRRKDGGKGQEEFAFGIEALRALSGVKRTRGQRRAKRTPTGPGSGEVIQLAAVARKGPQNDATDDTGTDD